MTTSRLRITSELMRNYAVSFNTLRRNMTLGIGLGHPVVSGPVHGRSVSTSSIPRLIRIRWRRRPPCRRRFTIVRRSDPECEDPKAYPFGTDGQGRDLYAVAVTGTWMEMRIGLVRRHYWRYRAARLSASRRHSMAAVRHESCAWMVDVLLTIPALLILVVIQSSLGDEIGDRQRDGAHHRA